MEKLYRKVGVLSEQVQQHGIAVTSLQAEQTSFNNGTHGKVNGLEAQINSLASVTVNRVDALTAAVDPKLSHLLNLTENKPPLDHSAYLVGSYQEQVFDLAAEVASLSVQNRKLQFICADLIEENRWNTLCDNEALNSADEELEHLHAEGWHYAEHTHARWLQFDRNVADLQSAAAVALATQVSDARNLQGRDVASAIACLRA